jgi:WD40 repeat protein
MSLKNQDIPHVFALAPDGKRLALAIENEIQMINLPDGELIQTLSLPSNLPAENFYFSALAWAGDGRLFAATEQASFVAYSPNGSVLHTMLSVGADDLPSFILAMAASPDDKLLVTLAETGKVRVWDTRTWQRIGEYDQGIDGGYSGSQVLFSSDGRYLAFGLNAGGPVSLFRTSDHALVWRGGVNAPAFSPDGGSLADVETSEEGGYRIVLRSTSDGSEVRSWPISPSMPAYRLLFSPDGSRLLAVDDESLRVWTVDGVLLTNIKIGNCQ